MKVRDRHALKAYLGLMRCSERRFAERAGIAHATLNHLLTGRRTTCSRRTAHAIEAALPLPNGLFFERE